MHIQHALAFLLAIPVAAQGAIQPCSVTATGSLGNGGSGQPTISPDGRWILFTSAASDLVPSDTNGFPDVFVRDRLSGAVTLVSLGNGGVQGNATCMAAGLSDDARYVLFSSLATNLVANDTNGNPDLFLRDRQLGTTVCVSNKPSGLPNPGNTFGGRMTGDGSFIVFSTTGSLMPADTNTVDDVYGYTVATGALELLSVSPAGLVGNQSSFSPAVSGDGRFVYFHGLASNLVPNDTNGTRDVFVRDRLLGVTTRLSVGVGGVQGNGESEQTSCSSDGRFVAFSSSATNLVPNDTNGVYDVFVHDRVAGVTERVSVSSAGAQGTGQTAGFLGFPSLSADGRYVAFLSGLTGIAGNVAVAGNVYVRDRWLGRTVLANQSSTGQPANGTSVGGISFPGVFVRDRCSISSDPPIVVFDSAGSNLLPGDSNTVADLFAVDVGLHAGAVGIATPGGAMSAALDAPGHASSVFVTTFGPTHAIGFYLPTMQWMPLDFDPLLTLSLGVMVTDAVGAGGWSVALPQNQALVGLSYDSVAVQLDFTGPSLFPAISNVVTFVIQ